MLTELQIMAFWDMTPCSDVVGYQHFGWPCCHHLKSEVNDARKDTLI